MFDANFNLDELIDPSKFDDPIDCEKEKSKKLLFYLEQLLKIRTVENKIAFHKKTGDIKGPVHLAAGQEAIAVGIANSLKKTDTVFGAHRSHSHILSLDSDIKKLFAEILGKPTGHCKGFGGSMHLQDLENGFYGSVPIVAGTIPIAVGAALALKMRLKNNIAVSYFGDGAVEEGVFHESLNLSKILKCPILFVCENNLFSSHMHISKRQPFSSQARFACVSGLKFKVIDGNNILECANAAEELIAFSRENNEPTFLEAVTYRLYGHVDWREDIDVGVNRSKKDLDLWKKRDPIKRLSVGLLNKGLLKKKEFEDMTKKIKENVDFLWEQATRDKLQNEKDLEKYLYAG